MTVWQFDSYNDIINICRSAVTVVFLLTKSSPVFTQLLLQSHRSVMCWMVSSFCMASSWQRSTVESRFACYILICLYRNIVGQELGFFINAYQMYISQIICMHYMQEWNILNGNDPFILHRLMKDKCSIIKSNLVHGTHVWVENRVSSAK